MLGQYFILWRVILQSEFSVSLFKAAGDILLKKGVFLLTVTTCIHVSKALSVFLMSISALIIFWYNLKIKTYLSQFKGVLLHDQTTFLLIYHKFCWITTNAYICQKCNVHSLSESENGIFPFFCHRPQCTYFWLIHTLLVLPPINNIIHYKAPPGAY